MTKISELIVFILLFPVITQIIVPLLILFGFCLLRAVRALLAVQDGVEERKNRKVIEEELQVNRV